MEIKKDSVCCVQCPICNGIWASATPDAETKRERCPDCEKEVDLILFDMVEYGRRRQRFFRRRNLEIE